MVHRPPVLLMLRSYNSFGLERALSLGAALVRQTQGTLPHLLDECPSLRLLQVLLVEDLLDAEGKHAPLSKMTASSSWPCDGAGRLADERRAEGQRSSARELYQRSMRSHWKTTVFNRYGGEIWLLTLIATGRVHASSVKIVNDIYADKIREDAGREPVSDPRLAEPLSTARASSQGQVRGVQHTKCEAGRLREAARHADKLAKWHDELWWKAHRVGHIRSDADAASWSRGSTRKWQEADRLWELADEESIEFANQTGNTYQKRDGSTYYPPGPPRVGTFERSLNTLKAKIEAGEVAWPPAP